MYKDDLNVMLYDLKGELDLITKSDQWLNQEKISLSADIDEKVKDLEKILLAMKIKNMLQSKNMVAVQQIIKTSQGGIKDIVIKIMSLPDAIDLYDKSENEIDKANYLQHIDNWAKDGYDIQLSKALRS